MSTLLGEVQSILIFNGFIGRIQKSRQKRLSFFLITHQILKLALAY